MFRNLLFTQMLVIVERCLNPSKQGKKKKGKERGREKRQGNRKGRVRHGKATPGIEPKTFTYQSHGLPKSLSDLFRNVAHPLNKSKIHGQSCLQRSLKASRKKKGGTHFCFRNSLAACGWEWAEQPQRGELRTIRAGRGWNKACISVSGILWQLVGGSGRSRRGAGS